MKQESTLIELHYFPSIQYMSKFFASSNVVLEQQENYRKGSYRNRMHIASANGLLRLSIPLIKGKNEKQGIREVRISYEEPWQNKHWTAIQSAYGNSPYFDDYSPIFHRFFKEKKTYLFDLNLAILTELLELLDINPSIQFTETYAKDTINGLIDWRQCISPKPNKSCADSAYKTVPYPQVFMEKTGFLPNLSILDLIFCQGPETVFTLQRSVIDRYLST